MTRQAQKGEASLRRDGVDAIRGELKGAHSAIACRAHRHLQFYIPGFLFLDKIRGERRGDKE
jgi:hypothetical protein